MGAFKKQYSGCREESKLGTSWAVRGVALVQVKRDDSLLQSRALAGAKMDSRDMGGRQ